MLEWYAGMMPQGISAARREMGVLQVKWMVERRIEESQGLMKEEVMRGGMKRGMFRDGNGPNFWRYVAKNRWGKCHAKRRK